MSGADDDDSQLVCDAMTETATTGLEDGNLSDEDQFDPQLEKHLSGVKERIEESPQWTWSDPHATALPSKSLAILGPHSPAIAPSGEAVKGKLQGRLAEAWRRMHGQGQDSAEPSSDNFPLTPLQQLLAGPMLDGMDTIDLSATLDERHERRKLYCLHALNQVLRTRARIMRNNQRLAESPDLEARDQGFTRPRVLLLAPLRNTALDLVKTLSQLWIASGGQVDNQTRLTDEFGPSEEDRLTDQRRRGMNLPSDFTTLFQDNIDDCFRLGIKCTRKSMKLFSDFYSSDIIIASPLGLRFILDGQSETRKVKAPGGRGKAKRMRTFKKGDSDFLSSIQLLIVEQADVILMQNWEHLLHTISLLNRLPKEAHDCDFSRVQSLFLDGLAGTTRQNLLFSHFPFPELNALLRSLPNCSGKVRLAPAEYAGILKACHRLTRPEIHPVPCKSLQSAARDRLHYFTRKILPSIPPSMTHICIFISSYLDFVQVREHFQTQNLSHCILSEYCTPPEVSAARTRFFGGQSRFLLVTERFHFFKRYRIRGIRNLIFFSLPEHPEYYEQWCSYLEEQFASSVPILLSPTDRLKAERILGTRRLNSILP